MRYLATIVTASALLSGCVNNDMSQLEMDVQQILARPPRGTIEPLPEVRIPETYLYQAGEANKPDPFRSFINVAARVAGAAVAADPVSEALRKKIELHGNAEELEAFELDSLRMVGSLEDADELWGIVVDRTGTVHRVKTGNFMGKNFGEIVSISEEKMEIREIIRTSDNSLEERDATLILVEPK
jgi:type IV pilus assembly protein PilP